MFRAFREFSVFWVFSFFSGLLGFLGFLGFQVQGLGLMLLYGLTVFLADAPRVHLLRSPFTCLAENGHALVLR